MKPVDQYWSVCHVISGKLLNVCSNRPVNVRIEDNTADRLKKNNPSDVATVRYSKSGYREISETLLHEPNQTIGNPYFHVCIARAASVSRSPNASCNSSYKPSLTGRGAIRSTRTLPTRLSWCPPSSSTCRNRGLGGRRRGGRVP